MTRPRNPWELFMFHPEVVFGNQIFLYVFIELNYNCIHVHKITKEWNHRTFLPHLTSFRVFKNGFMDRYSSSRTVFQSQSVSNSYWVLRQKKLEGTGWHKGLNTAMGTSFSLPWLSSQHSTISPQIHWQKEGYRIRDQRGIYLNRKH